MKLATPASRQLHAGAISLGSLAVASQALSLLPSRQIHFAPSVTLSQLLATGQEAVHTHGLPLVQGTDTGLGPHVWTSSQAQKQPGPSLHRFLNDKDDILHARINGLNTCTNIQDVLAALPDNSGASLTLGNTLSPQGPLARELSDQHANKHAKTTPLPLHYGAIPAHPYPTTAQSVSGSTGSVASSHSSMDSRPASFVESECNSNTSSLATSYSQEHEQEEVIVLATVEGKPDEDRNSDQEDNPANKPRIPKDHFGGEFECPFALEEARFGDWTDHIIKNHLIPREMSCPYCPEPLLWGEEGSHDKAIIKQRLEHLRTHSPWLEARCAWPVYMQYPQTCLNGVASATPQTRAPVRRLDYPKFPQASGEQTSKGGPPFPVPARTDYTNSQGLCWDRNNDLLALLDYATHAAPQQAGGMRHHGAGSGEGSGRTEPALLPSDEASRPAQSNGKRSRQQRRSDDAGEDGDDDESKHSDDRDNSIHCGTTPGPVAKYACPFFKHDQKKYADCAYTAVQDFPGVKKHLLQTHDKEFPFDQCGRCHLVFTNKADLDGHSEDGVAKVCLQTALPTRYSPVLTRKALSGRITLKASKASKTSKTSNASKSSKMNTDKWQELYRRMFPGTSPIPSPYNGTYEHIKHAPIIQVLKDSAYADVPPECAQFMAECLPALPDPNLQKIGACTFKAVSQYLLSKSELFQFPEGTTESSTNQCQAEWNDRLEGWQSSQLSQSNVQQDQTQDNWTAQIPLAISSGSAQQQSTVAGTDSGYDTSPNTYSF